MFSRLVSWVDSRIGLDAESHAARAVLRERFRLLKRQLPWVHGILTANLLGVLVAFRGHAEVSKTPAIILLAVIFVRAVLWLSGRSRNFDDREIRAEMRRTFLIATSFFLGSLAWNLSVYLALSGEDRLEIGAFAGLAAIGSSYGLSSFRAAATAPLLVLGLPFGCLLAVAANPAHAGIGVSLLIVLVVWFRLLNIQNDGLARLVAKRSVIEAERKRAIEAERIAVAERNRVTVIANTDPLTGLLNRRGFLAKLETQSLDERKKLALVIFDLDGFKPINDTFGHRTGDSILIEVSARLRVHVTADATIARLGGDEFALLFDCRSAGDALLLVQRAIESLKAPFCIDGQTMRLSACAGISYQHEDDVFEAIQRADLALYEAKSRGRGNASLFCGRMQEHVQRRTYIEQALREPEQSGQIEVLYQPVFDLHSLEIQGFEALARWNHPQLGSISPGEFIPITEQVNVLHEISDTLLKRAAADALRWPDSVFLSFNLSPVQLCCSGTARNVLDIIGREGLDPRRLQIEVTETALLADFEMARRNLSELRKRGVRVALDDFGAGYSSISYLREMRFDTVKLDGSLMPPLAHSSKAFPLLKGVLALCKAMKQDCVAEHVETVEQVQMLRQLGCRFAQGFGLAVPVDAQVAAQMGAGPLHLGLERRQGAQLSRIA